MINLEKVKEQAGVLKAYLLTVGKKLKHTHSLEAMARVHGYSSWNAMQSLAALEQPPEQPKRTGQDLAKLFASGIVTHVKLDDLRYEVRYYNSECLGSYSAILASSDAKAAESENVFEDYDLDSTCVELECVEDGEIWEEELTVRILSKAVYNRDNSWTLPDDVTLKLFEQTAI